MVEDDRELVAAEPCHGVALAHPVAQPAPGLAQDLVADRVPVGVVHVLEVVQVQEHQGEGTAITTGAFDLFGESVQEVTTVGQGREFVGVSQQVQGQRRGFELPLHDDLVTDVPKDHDRPIATALRPQERDVDLEGVLRSIVHGEFHPLRRRTDDLGQIRLHGTPDGPERDGHGAQGTEQ